ncbi:MAG: putative FMNH2-dependent monooxygenase SfnC [Chroococcidiopsis cubana SAG 39.79]|uniref:Dibenzothiophene monooxygenase n=1 Tax=Chroococcidiopsis cubana SAG 39.79 TaxID=388085 RepID=A0AB37UFR0_9CYAN|nr:acyl-CoA dehydrogenase family protein [Chroococcidiopsis cubana]MDZ4876580.1 putative FMNH2-dependent monooxygenase SfnC [Chroococcidiopsis cubana SAG 39.79]PSB59910.1 monooxygenase [Chroococcidiopsis cubana CCALA 043]RUT10358.1 FMNH2-dependent monooxygenase [Chroococcidiopsis cubana SAG 39.79]
MQLQVKESSDYIALAQSLAEEFAQTAIARDTEAGTPKQERDRLRQSNLLKLIIPKEYGGLGETWITALQITREFAKVDSSIAHIFSYHHLGAVVPHIFGSPEQKQRYYTQTARNNWFWCNALNPLDRRATLTPEGDYFRLDGIKSFCSGSKDSDFIPITATDRDTNEFTILVIPTQREGVNIQSDWDNMGQRQTDSGSIIFDHVLVHPDEILGSRELNSQPFVTIRACLTQLNFTNIYLGIAQGALAAAKQYTRTTTKPWLTSGAESATQDPYILQHYGSMWVDLQAATCLTDKAGELLQAAWDRQWELTAAQRGECAVAIATAKVAATKVGLEIANRIFEVMGARATSNQYSFDRYWRNLRTFTLHDPVDYKLRDIGNWVLNDELPQPSFYS